MRKLTASFVLTLALAWSGAAEAGSTINPSVPAANSPLSSGPVRSNFTAAYNDVNGIENCFSGNSPPGNPSTFQLWCDTTGAPTNVKVKQFDGSSWLITGFINQTTHSYTPAIAGGSILNTANIFTVIQTVDLGSGASEPSANSGAGLAIYSADGSNSRFEATDFSNSTGSAAIFDGRTSLGTRASPATVTSATLLASFEGKGYDSSVWTGTGGALHVYAQGTWSPSSHPGQACLATTPSGGTTTVNNFCVNDDGSATLVGALTAPASANLQLNAPTGQDIQLQVAGVAITVQQLAAFLPVNDNTVALGGVSNRWSAVYGVTGSFTSFGLSGNISSAAWTTNGARYVNVPGTLTDTTSSGTVVVVYDSVFGGNTIAASSVTTYTQAVGSYFKVPIAGTNVTFTNKYAIGADSLYIGGLGGAGISTLQINENAAALPTSTIVASAGATIFGADGINSGWVVNNFGAIGINSFTAFGGTAASPSALTTGTEIGRLGFSGATSSTTTKVNVGRVNCFAAENWSTTAYGLYCSIFTAVTGGSSPAITEKFRFQASGGLSVGNANIATDGGAGVIVANSLTVSSALTIANGGTGQVTASAAIAALMPTPTRAGDVAYWNGSIWTTLAGNNSGTLTLQENASGVPTWASVAGTGTVTSAVITGSGGTVTSGTCTITTSGSCNLAAAGGFLNFLRNNSLTSWFHGCVGSACTITTAGGWCAEGVWVVPTGASVTCQAVTTSTVGTPYYVVKITGAASVTDVAVRFVVESYQHAKFFSQKVTFQTDIVNTTGGTVTPTLATKYASGGQDNWGSSVTDLAATNLQACTSTSTCLEAYTLAVSGASDNGYEFVVDYGNNFSTTGKSVTINYFDARLDTNASTGLNSAPPPFEMRDPSSDAAWNERFYQTTYDNGVATATATHVGMIGTTGATSSNSGQMGNVFRTTMRCDPSVSFWDGAGNASKLSFWNGSTWADNQSVAPAVLNPGHHGFTFYNNLAGTNESFHYAADCTISGG